LKLKELSENEIQFAKSAVDNWKRLQDVILDGEQYRLWSPYLNEPQNGNHMAICYVAKDRKHAVMFSYDLMPRFGGKLLKVKLEGLEPTQKYLVNEINLPPGQKSDLPENGRVLSGDFLMKVGLGSFTANHMNSRVIELSSN